MKKIKIENSGLSPKTKKLKTSEIIVLNWYLKTELEKKKLEN